MKIYKAKVSTKGQVVIPKPIRDKLNLKPSSPITINLRGNNIVMESAKEYTPESGRGIIKTKKTITDKQIDEEIKKGYLNNFKKSL